MKLVIIASVILLVVGGLFYAVSTYRARTAEKGRNVARTSESNEATVTLAVAGMKKSKSGAT